MIYDNRGTYLPTALQHITGVFIHFTGFVTDIGYKIGEHDPKISGMECGIYFPGTCDIILRLATSIFMTSKINPLIALKLSKNIYMYIISSLTLDQPRGIIGFTNYNHALI